MENTELCLVEFEFNKLVECVTCSAHICAHSKLPCP
jgi:hypothetical protein